MKALSLISGLFRINRKAGVKQPKTPQASRQAKAGAPAPTVKAAKALPLLQNPGRRPYTREEDAFLMPASGYMKTSRIAELIDRTVSSVRSRKKYLRKKENNKK